MKRKLLFVDDEPRILQGLRRVLRGMRAEWDMTFVEGGQQALDALQSHPYDVVVSDMRMPGIDGIQLLTEIMHQHPHTVRIALSGHAEEESVLRTIGPVHEYLSKPYNATLLRETITRMCALQEVLEAEPLKQLMTSLTSLPSLPEYYGQTLKEVRDPSHTLSILIDLVRADEALSRQVLLLAHVTAVNPSQPPADIKRACQRLGLNLLAKFTLAYQVFQQFGSSRTMGISPEAVWEQSLRVGLLAREICLAERCGPIVVDDTLVGGLLHDLGKLVLSRNLEGDYQRLLAAPDTDPSRLEAERRTMGATHAEVGAYLLGDWGIPAVIVEAAAFHHQPGKHQARTFSTVTAVYSATMIDEALARAEGQTLGANEIDIDRDYLETLGLADRLPSWTDRCLEAVSRFGERGLWDARRIV